MKLSLGDSVIIISGKDKGKKGTVMRVLHTQNRVIVSGVNLVTKHVKKTTQEAGRKMQYESSIHASNVMILDPKTGKGVRIGYKVDSKTGKKTRVARGSGTELARVKGAAKSADAPKNAKPNKKSPFWKRVGFGADAAVDEVGGAKTEAAVPAAPTHTRSAGRGS